MAVHYPDHLEEEQNRIWEEFFKTHDPEDDFDEEAFNAFYEERASEELKQMDREMREYFANCPPGLH